MKWRLEKRVRQSRKVAPLSLSVLNLRKQASDAVVKIIGGCTIVDCVVTVNEGNVNAGIIGGKSPGSTVGTAHFGAATEYAKERGAKESSCLHKIYHDEDYIVKMVAVSAIVATRNR